MSEKEVDSFYFYDNGSKRRPTFVTSTVEIKKDLWKNYELKLPPLRKLFLHYLAKVKCSAVQLYSTVSSN